MDAVPLPVHRLRRRALPRTHPQASVFLPALVILVGMLLRLSLLGLDVRFHPDEALYAAQARLISQQGDLLLRDTDLDKPPLPFYATALSFRALGSTEFAARLPNVLFSSLSLAALVALAWALYGDWMVAALVALLVAFSPYDLAFAATVFTDVQATFWTLIAALCVVRERWTSAGIAAALIFAAKPNSLLFLPLIAALSIARHADSDWTAKGLLSRLWGLAWPLALGIGIVVLWDLGRAPRSFLSLGYARYDPGRLIRADEVWPRLEQWAHWLGLMTGSQVVNFALLAAGPLWLVRQIRRRSRAAAADWLIAGFGVAFMAWHWLIAFNTYDRYLHTLTPFALLLAARALVGIGRLSGARRAGPAAVGAIVILLMLPSTVQSLRGEAALGGDQGQHTGIDALADTLNTRLSGQIVYDHWLGWELAYYLGESPQVSLIYYSLPEALADDVAHQTAPRYFAAPSPPIAAPWIAALERVHIQIDAIYLDTANGFVIYRLELPH